MPARLAARGIWLLGRLVFLLILFIGSLVWGLKNEMNEENEINLPAFSYPTQGSHAIFRVMDTSTIRYRRELQDHRDSPRCVVPLCADGRSTGDG